MIKSKTIFEHLNDLFNKSVTWSNLSDESKKSFSVYMINRFLSMNMDYIEIVNELQPYTMGELTPELVYKLYKDLLPKGKFYFKYIKSKKEEKYNSELILFVSKREDMSTKEVEDGFDVLNTLNIYNIVMTEYLKLFGYTESEISKFIKIGK